MEFSEKFHFEKIYPKKIAEEFLIVFKVTESTLDRTLHGVTVRGKLLWTAGMTKWTSSLLVVLTMLMSAITLR